MTATWPDTALTTANRARWALALMHSPASVLLLLNTATTLTGNPEADARLLPFALALLAIQALISWRAANRVRLPYAVWWWVAQLGLCGLLYLGAGGAELIAIFFAGASAVLVLPRPIGGIVFFALCVPVMVGWSAWTYWDGPLLAQNLLYSPIIFVSGAAGVLTSVWMVRVVDDLTRTRGELALRSAERERRRLSRDVHDAVGQGLSAIALKGDLALASLEPEPAVARREVRDLVTMVSGLRSDLPKVVRDELVVSFDEELRRATRLLRDAGIDIRVEGDIGRLDHAVEAALAWAVRECATNVLRHSTARRWQVRCGRETSTAWLEFVNRGAHSSKGGQGSGLVGLADRVGGVGGRVRSDHDGDRFSVRVEVPA
jgi:two-component system sensor histidine kinase DesK